MVAFAVLASLYIFIFGLDVSKFVEKSNCKIRAKSSYIEDPSAKKITRSPSVDDTFDLIDKNHILSEQIDRQFIKFFIK